MNDMTTRTETGVATTSLSPWGQVERMAKQEGASLILFKKGDWLCGDDEVGEKEYRTEPTEIYYGWQHWRNSTPGPTQMVRIDQLAECPRRDDLGDLDKSKWESAPDGKSKDPWVRTVRMGLVDLETDELYFFTSSSHGGRGAVNDFCAAFDRGRHQFPDQVPIVTLDTESYKHKKFGKVVKPKFTVSRWVTRDGSAPKPIDPGKQIADELNDELPAFTI